MHALLDRLKRNPLLSAAIVLGLLILVALVLGLIAPKPPAASSTVASTPVEKAPVPAEPSRATPIPAPAAAPTANVAAAVATALRPAALPLAATPPAGAREEIASGNEDGTTWLTLDRRELRDGTPMASIDTKASREVQPRGWQAVGWMRVTRSGLFRTDTAGTYALIESVRSPDTFGNRHANCRVAVDDPNSTVAAAKAGDAGEASGAASLAAGWHWLYLVCEVESTHATVEVAMTAPNAGAPAMLALHLPQGTP